MTPYKATPERAAPSLRDTLFGDLPLAQWPPAGASTEASPWHLFAAARQSLDAGDTETARRCWHEVLRQPVLESRHHVQAWTFLRAHGEQPPAAEGKRVYGVVVEVGLAEGLDLLAAYEDRTARYYNYSGAGVVWERPDDRLDGQIDALLAHSAAVVQRIGPWDQPRLPAPGTGQTRVSFLTPSGLHFGQGTMEALYGYPLAVPLLDGAMALMAALIDLPRGAS